MGLRARITTGTLLAFVPFCLTPVRATAPATVALDATISGNPSEAELIGAGNGSAAEISAFVQRAVSRRMKGESEAVITKVAATILEESRARDLDPLLIVAVIERESSFRAKVRGGVGEVGLMQIRPSTGQWIATREGIPWKGLKTLLDPVTNIRLGTRYLAALREELAEGPLYLAAYNMGIGNVLNMLKRNRKPREYPLRIMTAYRKLQAELQRDLVIPERATAASP